MKIGITYDLKADAPASADLPDDFQEEFDSPVTINGIASVLRDLGHEVIELGDGRGMLEKVQAAPPNFECNFAEGQGVGRSREARVPAVLEMLGIPYTGIDSLTPAATMDKACEKRLVESAGVLVPARTVMDAAAAYTVSTELTFPVIFKPSGAGSKQGILDTSLVVPP